MKAHRITCLVIDPNHPNTPASEYAGLLEINRYVSPTILSVESAEIGEWHDDHPLNMRDTMKAEAARIFAPPTPTTAAEVIARRDALRAEIRKMEAEIRALPKVAGAWAADREGTASKWWIRDLDSKDGCAADIYMVEGGFGWSVLYGPTNIAPTLDEAKKLVDNTLIKQGYLLA